ncbi:MAG: hypothetical protein EOO40_06510 [Deltaproteobacteria bacterium]|nr:MAG: hypothetical protein EOO40_06510 [Deltaproteobacteria bacterium]
MWPKHKTEANDKFYQGTSGKLAKLRGMQARKPEYAVAVADVYATLAARKDFVRDHDLWVELYHRSVMMYPYQSRVAGLPFINVTKHNHVVPFYASLRLPPTVPLVHWDTHSDLNAIKDSGTLVGAAGRGDMHKVQDRCWDIGAAMTGVLLLPGPPRDMVWVTPSWVPDPETSLTYWKHRQSSGNVVLANCDTASQHPLALVRLYKARTACQGPSGTISVINLGRQQAAERFRRLLDLVPRGVFALDIDLDVFVCNGRPLRKALYMKEGYDVCSESRARMKELNDMPRDMYSKRTRQCYDLSRTFRKEVRLLEGRLRAFETQLRFLKREGRVPCAISISDSTGVSFTDCTSCSSTGNNYMPTYYAAFVNQKVLDILRRVY